VDVGRGFRSRLLPLGDGAGRRAGCPTCRCQAAAEAGNRLASDAAELTERGLNGIPLRLDTSRALARPFAYVVLIEGCSRADQDWLYFCFGS